MQEYESDLDGFEAIVKLIHETPEGKVVYVVNMPNGVDVGAGIMSFDELCTLTNDPSRFFIISTTVRCGFAYFMRHLELKHFPPSTPKNNLLLQFDFKWKTLPFSCLSVPKIYHREISNSLVATNMKPIYGALPHVIEASGMTSMPLCQDNCISIENGEDHIAYKATDEEAHQWQHDRITELEIECGLRT